MLSGAQEIFVLVGAGLIGAISALFIKDTKLPGFSILIALAVGALIFMRILPRLGQLLELFENLALQANLSTLYLGTIFKVLGIAYITEFGAQLCRDAGQGAIAIKLEFAAKIGILLLSMPIMISVLKSILELLR